jgi:hypothetical protein
MPSRKPTFRRQQRSVKRRRLLDEVTPTKSKKSTTTITPVLVDLVIDGSQSQSANEIVTASSYMLKRHEDEVKKDKKLSPDPTLSRQQPMREQRQQEQELLNVRNCF